MPTGTASSFRLPLLHAQQRESRMNPHRNPPVCSRNTANPPRKPANTGIPAAPAQRYTNKAGNPVFMPPITAQRTTPNTCIVTGIPDGRGMAICAVTARTAVSIAVCVIMRTETFLIDISCRLDHTHKIFTVFLIGVNIGFAGDNVHGLCIGHVTDQTRFFNRTGVIAERIVEFHCLHS